MAKHFKKAVLLIAASAALYAPEAFCANSTASAEPNTQTIKKFDFAYAKDPNFTFGQSGQPSSREMFCKMVFAVMIVTAFGLVAVYISKKLSRRIVNAPGREVRMLETLHLGSHKTLHLIKFGNQRILIGCTNENITKLAEIIEDNN